jgi:outer membrane receptor protein involved in Fe transport
MRSILKILLAVFMIMDFVLAGTKGKIAGRIIDAETKEPLPGVNVVLEGTTLGAATDLNGFYVITNIPPGTYTVVVSAVGYRKVSVKNVKVSADLTTTLNFELEPEAIGLPPVVVEAERPLVRADLTSSQVVVDAEQIRQLPVENFQRVLTLQAGVTVGAGGDIHIRGGRTYEIAFTIDGVSINDPFFNTLGMQIARNAIQEMTVVSGTFNAEYGNAMSGVVNIVTKEGGQKYTGELLLYSGDYVSRRKDIFFNIDKIDPLNNSVIEFSLGGPFPAMGKFLSFFTSLRVERNKGWLYGVREHQPSDQPNFNDPNNWIVPMTGDSAIVPMNPSRNLNTTAKLTFRFSPTVKLNLDGLYDRSWYKSYNHLFKYNPDGTYQFKDENYKVGLSLSHALSNKTYYELRVSYTFQKYRQYVYEDPLDPRYQPVERLARPTSFTFYFGGTQNDHVYRDSRTYMFKFDITSQVSNYHEIKTGVELRLHKLDYVYFTILRDTLKYLEPTIPDITSPYHNRYTRQPVIFSVYAQDKMEYKDMIVNFGLRYDYFNPKANYSRFIFYPDPNDPTIPPIIQRDTLIARASPKHQISPRLGVSYPITDRGILHFSYGWFLQMPPFTYLYTNPEFESALFVGTPTFGNANLKPEKTVAYEFGLQQQFTDNFAINVTAFYKDVRDLLALQRTRISQEKVYNLYVNKDYGNIKGITFSLIKRRLKDELVAATLDYTYQVAEGNDPNPDAFFIDLKSGREPEKFFVYLDWDQRHTLNGTISIGIPDNWMLSFVGQYGSGLPYTPYITNNRLELRRNSERKPATMQVDMMFEKLFKWFGLRWSFFVKVYNLFDTLNERYVFDDTGTAQYTLAKQRGEGIVVDQWVGKIPGIHPSDDYYTRPHYYYPPREVRFGFSIGF